MGWCDFLEIGRSRLSPFNSLASRDKYREKKYSSSTGVRPDVKSLAYKSPIPWLLVTDLSSQVLVGEVSAVALFVFGILLRYVQHPPLHPSSQLNPRRCNAVR
jgi:hypothetical protein